MDLITLTLVGSSCSTEDGAAVAVAGLTVGGGGGLARVEIMRAMDMLDVNLTFFSFAISVSATFVKKKNSLSSGVASQNLLNLFSAAIFVVGTFSLFTSGSLSSRTLITACRNGLERDCDVRVPLSSSFSITILRIVRITPGNP